jgi:hypothetical protein
MTAQEFSISSRFIPKPHKQYRTEDLFSERKVLSKKRSDHFSEIQKRMLTVRKLPAGMFLTDSIKTKFSHSLVRSSTLFNQ